MSQYNKLEAGQVVLSTCGRDMGKLQMVLEILDDSYVLVVDGKQRKIEKPKKKKTKHLQKLNKKLSLENLTDKKLRMMLNNLKKEDREKNVQ
ncbi:KOW domain-containing RNA-binding protein [uncultured Finegoldia sp.]|uniref:KOW domain-containing RNA-binding protein n=1 Tax=uncultured Finegoldia sp. TaxID=328009 RepID=UPI0026016FCF|nr:KOW domain-containing RNA-binding protein [uncultured Finegoldia sp.]